MDKNQVLSQIQNKVEAASDAVLSRLKNSVRAKMSGQELLLFFYNYVKFNQVFSGCVTNLSSQFHLHFIQSNSVEAEDQIFTDIAADIFESAHHEYLHPTSPAGATATHKELSNFFVDNLALTLDENKNFWTGKHYFYKEYVEIAMRGYGVETSRENNQLFYSLGFHIASEASASGEFEYLATLLSTNYPILKDKLSRTSFKPQSTSGINAFTWLKVHGEIEKEHYGSIFRAVGRIFNSERNYDYPEVQKDLISICDGINDFHRMMNLFFTTFENLAFEAKNTK